MKPNHRKRGQRRRISSAAACCCCCCCCLPAAMTATTEAAEASVLHQTRIRSRSAPRMGHEQHKPLHLRFLQQREDISLFGVASNVVPGPCGSIGNTPFVSRRHVMCRILRIRGGDSQAAQPPLPPPPPPPPPSTGLTEVYENEIYSPDDQSWSAAASSSSFARWTNPDGTSSPPPTAIAAPAGYDFADEWKIDVTGVGISRDDLGWEYSSDRNGMGRRRRRWLRKLKVRICALYCHGIVTLCLVFVEVCWPLG